MVEEKLYNRGKERFNVTDNNGNNVGIGVLFDDVLDENPQVEIVHQPNRFEGNDVVQLSFTRNGVHWQSTMIRESDIDLLIEGLQAYKNGKKFGLIK